ncbi:MAG: hypothetical protein JNM75_08895 [Rhodospirillales bacterium]|nr:hypothetical protein [Rhodospirillales bacterium]
MTDTKPWFLSKGFVGPLIAVVAIALENMDIIALDSNSVSDIVFQMIALAGAAFGMIGRAVADKRLTKM